MRIAALALAPVKGCGRSALKAAAVDAHGLVGDRELLFVADGSALRTFQNPALLSLRARVTHGVVSITAPDGTAAFQRWEPGPEASIDYWGRRVTVSLQDGPVPALASEYLGRLVRLGRVEPAHRVIYANPVSIGLLSRLGALEASGAADVERFRCNVVVDDREDPVPEVGWLGRTVRSGDVELRADRQLQRCVVIDHNPRSGVRDRRLLRSLSDDGPPLAGLGADVVTPGTLRVGEPCALLDA